MQVGKKKRLSHFRLESSSLPNEVSMSPDSLEDDNSNSNARESSDSAADKVVNRLMIVVDSCLDSSGALEWVLSRAIQGQDSIILLHLIKHPLNQGFGYLQRIAKANEVLRSMKVTCQKRKPGVKVEEVMVGVEKTLECTIVEEAKKLKASVLVLGLRRQSIMWRLLHGWTSSAKKRQCGCEKLVDYCIHNAHCLTVGVRRRSRSRGAGYVVKTKAHDNFWLLA